MISGIIDSFDGIIDRIDGFDYWSLVGIIDGINGIIDRLDVIIDKSDRLDGIIDHLLTLLMGLIGLLIACWHYWCDYWGYW